MTSAELIQIIGEEKFQLLCRVYPGTTFRIPKSRRSHHVDIQMEYVAYVDEGLRPRDAIELLANKWSLTERSVWRILRKGSQWKS